ncbi:hypothetical protein [Methanoculleus chikugoensis]|nr:hypothetical protein [Methanoculleus chikugoensis]
MPLMETMREYLGWCPAEGGRRTGRCSRGGPACAGGTLHMTAGDGSAV